MLYLKLSAHGTALSRLIVSGFGHTRRLLQHLQPDQDWQGCGVLQLAFEAKEAERQLRLAEAFPASLLRHLDREQAEAVAGIPLPAGGLFYRGRLGAPTGPVPLAGRPARHPPAAHSEALQLRRETADGRPWMASG